MLTGRGLLATHTKAQPGQRAYQVVSVTEQVGGRAGRCGAWPGWFGSGGEQLWWGLVLRRCLGPAGAHSLASPASACAPGFLLPPPAPRPPHQGAAFLRSSEPLVLQLSGELAAQEREAAAAAAAAAERAAAAAALEAQRDGVRAEEQRLFRALQDVRKVRRQRV